MSKEKYNWNYQIKWVVEFQRKDAEISIDLDAFSEDKNPSDKFQKVIAYNCKSTEEAKQKAIEYCKYLDVQIKTFIRDSVKHLNTAKV